MKKIFIARWRQASCLAVLLLNFNFHAAGAALANVWHIPDGTGDVGVNMRNRRLEVGFWQRLRAALQPDQRYFVLQNHVAKHMEQPSVDVLFQHLGKSILVHKPQLREV
jgi:hypothetical protein